MVLHSEAMCHKHQEQRLQRRSVGSAGTILVNATIHLACWSLVGSIGYATSPQPLVDDAITLALIFLWLIQIATGFCLMAIVAPSLAASSSAAIIGATIAAIHRTLMASPGNGAILSFWIVAGAYVGLAAEAVFGIVQMLQDSIAHRFEMNASTRSI